MCRLIPTTTMTNVTILEPSKRHRLLEHVVGNISDSHKAQNNGIKKRLTDLHYLNVATSDRENYNSTTDKLTKSDDFSLYFSIKTLTIGG